MREALAHHDFGMVFTAIRERTGLSQYDLGQLVGLNQERVSKIERRTRKVAGLDVAIRISVAFEIPAQFLGFPGEASNSLAAEEVDWVERRDFLSVLMAAALGSNLHPELDRLSGQLPERLKDFHRTRIGVKDVEAIEALSEYYRCQDLAHGSALYRDAALTQLREVRTYQHVACSEALRPRLWVATAELAWVTGWLAYDLEDHDGARRLWTYAVWAAGQGADHPHSADLAANILLDTAHQSLHLWRPLWTAPEPDQRRCQQRYLDEALRCAQTAAATASSRRYPVSSVTEGYIASVTAWCWAARGDAEAVHRSIERSEDLYAQADRNNLPAWSSFLTAAEISAQHGHSHYLLSTHDRDHAAQAIELLTAGVDGHAVEHARSKAVALPTLAGAYLQAGDHDSAAYYCGSAIQQINALTSRRCYTRLRDLNRIAAQYDRDSAVTDMRAHIADTVALPT
ncbi:helix-turn-helix transcriptional regulator [Nocardia sp. NPDC049707]|uniref:helix-turn-helix domain-containing protein n=1 Tax=Nocardia sp. NPDC049707 TaxID=3154735 RepID=UPI003427250D